MLKIDAYEFATAIVKAIEAFLVITTDDHDRLDLEKALKHARDAAKVATFNPSKGDRMESVWRERHKVELKDAQNKLRFCNVTNMRTDTKPISFCDTLKWLIQSFFHAQADAERRFIVCAATQLSIDQESSWYVEVK